MLCLLLAMPGMAVGQSIGTRIEQTRNGTPNAPISDVDWVTTAVNAQNGHFVEGSSMPYRLVFETLLPGPHRVVIAWDTKTNGRHATDYLTYHERLQPHNQFGAHNVPERVEPLRDISGGLDGPTTFPIPAPSIPNSSFGALPANQRLFHIFNGNITAATYLLEGGLENPSAETRLAIDFVANDSPVVILFGGHLAAKTEWGVGRTAGGVAGAAYRMRVVEVDGLPSVLGVTLNATAVVSPPACLVGGLDTVCPGTTNTYTATTDGAGASYNWSLIGNSAGASIVGPNSGASVLVRAVSSGAYTLQVAITQDAAHSACSQRVTVLTNTSATALANTTTCPDGTAGFLTEPSGSGPFSFVWRRGHEVLPNENKNVLALRNVTAAQAGVYCVEVAGACNSVTNCALLTVLTNTSATPLQSLSRCAGESAVFTTTAGGTGPFTYRWRKNGAVLFGQTNRIFTISSVTMSDGGTYTVEVAGVCGSVTNSATLAVNGLPPCGISGTNLVCPGSSHVYVGPPNMAAYQWRVTGNGGIVGPTNQQAVVLEAGSSGFLTVQLAVVNSNGCARTCTRNVNVGDIQPPVIVCPENIETNTAPGQCARAVNYSVSASDNCNGATVVCDPPSGSTFPTGTTMVNCTASDNAGNQSACAFSVTVLDLERAILTCPTNLVMTAEAGLCEARVTYEVSVTDNCPGASLSCTPPSGTIFPLGTSTVSCRATDASGNVEVCGFNVTVVDREPPQIFCSPDLTQATEAGQCEMVVDYEVAAVENCGVATVTCVPPSGSVFSKGATLVTCMATDASNNQSECSFKVTVDDLEIPRITCPADLQVPAESGRCDAVVNYVLKVNDNCSGVTSVCTPPSGTRLPLGQANVTCTATDASGNTASCSFKVTVADAERPALQCPGDLTVNAQAGRCDAVVEFTVNAADNCPGVRTECVPPSGSLFGVGTTVVNCGAVDASSNGVSCAFNVAVLDAELPRIVCPELLATNTAPGQCGAVVNYGVGFADNCPGAKLYCEPASGSFFPVGQNFAYCVAIDASGNAQDCWFFVEVEDTEPPVVQCPANVTLNTEPGRCDAIATFSVSASDNCGAPSLVCSPPSGTRFAVGQTQVACLVTDSSGNTNSCSFSVTVTDRQNPTLVCSTNITSFTQGGYCQPQVSYEVAVSDNCPGAGISCAPPSGSAFAVGTNVVNCTATDASGNTAQCSFTVTVLDREVPVILCAGDLLMQTQPGGCAVPVVYPVSASDDCGSATVICAPPTGSLFAKGTNLVNCTATDASGNAAGCSFRVVVEDREAPVMTCPGNVITNTAPGRCDATVTYALGVSDNCPGTTVICAPPSGSAFALGFTTVNCAATDASGNTNRCTFTVRVDDSEKPVLACPANIVRPADPGACDAEVTFAAPASDNCALQSLECVPASGTRFVKGIHTVLCSAIDSSGNRETCSFTVTVHDVEPPVAVCSTNRVVATDPGRCDATVNFAAGMSENCPAAMLVCVPPSGASFPTGQTAVNCTATDESGNTSHCSFLVIVNELERPEVICPADVVVNAEPGGCEAAVTFAPAFADNCPGGSVVCQPPSGSRFSVGATVVACTGTDAAGNVTACAFTVTVRDLQPPMLQCPGEVLLEASPGGCQAVFTNAPMVIDNCPGATIVCNPSPGTSLPLGTAMVDCVASDASGNTSQCRFIVTVLDREKPQIACPQVPDLFTSPGQCDVVATFSPSANDNCSGVSVHCIPPSGSRFPLGTTIVTCAAVDESDNAESCSFTVRVRDIDPPLLTCPTSIVIGTDAGRCDAAVSFAPAATDNCPGVTLVCVPPSGTRFPRGTTQVGCTATDGSSNTVSCAFSVWVEDHESPRLICPGNLVRPADPGRCSAVVSFQASVADNCPGAEVVCEPPSGWVFPIGTNTVTCNATDASGNEGTCSFTVVVQDDEEPTIVCSGNIATNTEPGRCYARVDFVLANVGDNCSQVSVVCEPPSGSQFAKGITSVTCTATDAGGNEAACAFAVTVTDTEPPIITCPQNMALTTEPGLCTARATFAAQVSDNCPGAILLGCVPPSDSLFPVGTTSVSCQARDAAGNTRVCSFTVQVADAEPPQLSCPADMIVNTDTSQCAARVSYGVLASDPCGLTNLACVPPSDSVFAKGVTQVQCSAGDGSGNQSTCAFTVTVRDLEAPALSCPSNMVLSADPGRCDVAASYSPAFSDNCAGTTLLCTPPSGSRFSVGTNTVRCTATDFAGNTNQCSFTVRVVDNERPILLCSTNIVANCEANRCDAAVSFAVSALDNCAAGPVNCTPASGSRFPLGATPVNCSASDAAGNSVACTFTVTVRDTQPPTVNCPSNIVVFAAAGRCDATVHYTAAVNDNCSGVTQNCSPPSGSVFAVGATVVNCTVIDSGTNSAACQFTVTVRDAAPPTIQCPSDITVNCATSRCDAVVTFAPLGSDNCPGVTLTCAPPSGSSFGKGTNLVTCTARDASSNAVSCVFRVIVRDVEKPNIVCPEDIITGTAADQCRARVPFSVAVTDNCPGATILCTPASNSFFSKGVSTVVCVATDASGNTNRCSFSVTVNDTELPSIVCPANIVTNASGPQLSTRVQFAPTVADNCPGVTYTCSPQSGSMFFEGTTPVTCTATDGSGNTRNCTFTVTVNDDEPPVINCPTNVIAGTTPGRCDAVVNFSVTATDNSQMVTLVCTPPSGSILPKGMTNVTCVARDPASNSVSCSFSVTVADLQRPVITCPTNLTLNTWPGRCDARAIYSATATDNCGGVSVICIPPSNSFFSKGTNTVTCTATDTSGNVETCGFAVRVLDNERPLIECPTNMLIFAPAGQCDAAVTYNTSATDNCPGVTLACSPASGSAFSKGATTVNCTARDTSGNTAACSFVVEVRDAELPVVTCPVDIETAAFGNGCGALVSYVATVRDNCAGAGLACNPPSGSSFPVGTNVVTCIATDTGGNTATCSFRVIVRDGQRPTLGCPGDIIIDGSTGECSPVAVYDPAVQDNCPGSTVTCIPPSGSTFREGTNRVFCTAVDRVGNTANCTFSVVVRLQPVTASALQSQVVCAGQPVTFATTPAGTGPFTFTWTKDGAVMLGRTNASLTLSPVAASDAGTYAVAVRGPCSGVTNSATLAVNTPVSVNGLTNVVRCDCDPLILTATATGTGPLSYLWRKNGAVLPGVTGSTLAFSKLSTNDAATYTVEVSGACNTASRSVTVGVIRVPNPAVYTNGGVITINDRAPAFPYPSSVQVSCVPGPLKRATVTLRGFNHSYPDDVDVLLTGPNGQLVTLISDAGDATLANNVNITLDDLAPLPIPDAAQLVSGTFRPGNYDDVPDNFPPPAPKLPYHTTLGSVEGTSANGFWSLFVVDDFQLDHGAINNGWVLRLYWETTPIRLSHPRILANGGLQFTVTGEPQHTYVIQTSTDMISWTPVGAVTLSTTQADFTDPAPPPVCFYRAVEP